MSNFSSLIAASLPFQWCRMGELSGTTLADASGHGRTCALGGTPTLGAPGTIVGDTDTSITFNGVDQDAFFTGSLGQGNDLRAAYTVSAFVKTSTGGSNNTIYAFSNVHAQVRALGGQFGHRAFSAAGATNEVVGGTIVAGQWHHVVATFDGTTMRLYVDGALAGTPVVSGPLYDTGLGGAFGLGISATVPGGRWSGGIDEVVVWDRALTLAEIQAMRTAALVARASIVEGMLTKAAGFGFNF